MGLFSDRAAPARKRLDKAKQLANVLKQMSKEKLVPSTKQAIWTIPQKCVARALQYDLRVLEKTEILPLAKELDEVVLDVAMELTAPHAAPMGCSTDSTRTMVSRSRRSRPW